MKDTLKRMLGITPASAQAETQKEDLQMDVINDGSAPAATADTVVVEAASLEATVASLTEKLATAHAEVAELKELVAKATEFQEAQVKAAAEAKSASRLSQLASALGDAQAAVMNASLAKLDDEEFKGVVASLGAKSAAEANTPLFKEVGIDGEVDATKLADESKTRVLDYLTSKYKAQ